MISCVEHSGGTETLKRSYSFIHRMWRIVLIFSFLGGGGARDPVVFWEKKVGGKS